MRKRQNIRRRDASVPSTGQDRGEGLVGRGWPRQKNGVAKGVPSEPEDWLRSDKFLDLGLELTLAVPC